MAAPTEVLWDLEPHSVGKHRLLRKYLDAWLPILAQAGYRRILLVDGFAGPGRYRGGEDGSPIIMLKAFLEHRSRAVISRSELLYFFIERDGARLEHLLGEISTLMPTPPANVKVRPIRGEFREVMADVLAQVGLPVPTFVFIDPFGYEQNRVELTSSILGYSTCEVLVYLPTRFIARFMAEPDTAEALSHLYGGQEWRDGIDLTGRARLDFLRDLFATKLRRSATHVRSFEIATAGGGGYDLFFATNSRRGLEKMKDAMWAVDPERGERFRDTTRRDQLVLFEPEPDPIPLLRLLQHRFGREPFTVQEAVDFVLFDTAYHPGKHLKRMTLMPAEARGELVVDRGAARRGSYPEGAVLRFA
ncbi:MAG: three-Cys-motif partner protein TcmP [Isosphaeraceae bacterium]|nr:three-Cys-motif partner protein TcmP [Isosphaeraceae bacterium]